MDIANLLLRITGDTKDGDKSVDEFAKKLRDLGQEEAKPSVTLDDDKAQKTYDDIVRQLDELGAKEATPKIGLTTDEAKRELDSMETRLKKLALTETDTSVQVKMADFLKDVAEVQALLTALDNEDIEVKVDIDKGLFARVQQLSSSFDELKGAEQLASDAAGGGAGGLRFSLGGLAGEMGSTQAIGLALAAVLGGALVAGLVALAASLTAAVAGLIALAVAGFGAILAVVPLAIGLMARFKETSKEAGTAANELRVAGQGFIKQFMNAIRPASIAVFRALADLLNNMAPVVRSLEPAFTTLGHALATSIGMIGTWLSSPSVAAGFKALLSGAAQLAGPATQAFIAFVSILMDIARAAMPLLISGMQSFANLLTSVANHTADIGAVRGVIGGLVSQLASWLKLLGAVSKLMIAFVSVVAPSGQTIVDWLTEGVNKLTGWVNSAKGTDRIKQFFTDVMPLIKATVILIGQLIILFFQIVQAVAPALTVLINGLNFLLGVINSVVSAIMPWLQVMILLGASLIGFAGKFKLLVAVVLAAIGAITSGFNVMASTLSTIWGAISGAASAAWSAISGTITGVAKAVVGFVAGIFTGFISTVTGIWSSVHTATSNAWSAIRGTVVGAATSLVNGVRTILNGIIGAAASVWSAVHTAATAAWSAIKTAITTPISAAVGVIRGLVDNFASAGRAIMGGVKDGVDALADQVKGRIKSGVEAGLGVIRGLAGDFFSAGKALVQALINGIESMVGAALGKLKDLAGKMKSLLPGSEPKDKSSPLYRLKDSGRALMENFAAGIPLGADKVMKNLEASLRSVPLSGSSSTAVQPLVVAPNVTRNFHLPPGPSPIGGFDPQFAAAQLDALLRDEGVAIR